jgi:hypothetical protein
VVLLANTSSSKPFEGHVLIDRVLNHVVLSFKLVLSNLSSSGSLMPVTKLASAVFWDGPERKGSAPAASLKVELEPMEFQVWAQAK